MRPSPRYYVYVIELSERERGPDVGRCDVYVGSSIHPPKERFRKHMLQDHASRHVRRRGLRLRPDLYAGYNPLKSREAAKRAEQHLAHSLAYKGHRVFGACTKRETPECMM